MMNWFILYIKHISSFLYSFEFVKWDINEHVMEVFVIVWCCGLHLLKLKGENATISVPFVFIHSQGTLYCPIF